MNFQPILYVIGYLLIALGGLMAAPALLDWFSSDPAWLLFVESSLITLFIGTLLVLANKPSAELELSLRETFILTTATWVTLIIFASLPMMFSTITASYVDSLFEATSALTSTGSTVLVGLDYAPKGILLWRALLQWMGGVGIIVMAITILPLLRIGGMQLFHSEFSDRSEKILPRVSQITKAIFWTYTGLTVLCMAFLYFAGMNLFDAFCHACTCISTGGLSNYDSSIGYFNSPLIEFILMLFMILAATPLILHVRFLYGDYGALWRDGQVKTFLFTFILLIPSLLTLYRWFTTEATILTSARESFFNYISIITTTGYSSGNYTQDIPFLHILFIAAMLVGGCTGSTAGGIKIFRVKIFYALTKTQMYKQYRTHAIHIPTFDGQEITMPIILSVTAFLTLFFISFSFLSLVIAATGQDILTSLSAAIACLSSAGLGLGDTIGPDGNYSSLSDTAKYTLIIAMILGRLELITVLVLLRPSFWKK
ncbi:MAG: TrkH family potassium uptake protein [Alphaproteobacteria bacterium]|nr:TrkH family potassium uptake protein [Alphaproteobacteria bacterium]